MWRCVRACVQRTYSTALRTNIQSLQQKGGNLQSGPSLSASKPRWNSRRRPFAGLSMMGGKERERERRPRDKWIRLFFRYWNFEWGGGIGCIAETRRRRRRDVRRKGRPENAKFAASSLLSRRPFILTFSAPSSQPLCTVMARPSARPSLAASIAGERDEDEEGRKGRRDHKTFLRGKAAAFTLVQCPRGSSVVVVIALLRG